MDYVIIGLLIVILILVVVSLFKNINESNITDRLSRLEVNMMKEMGDFKSDLSRSLNEDFTKLNEQVERRLLAVNEKVNERLDQNFEKTNKTFMNVIERLSKIDEAQKKIETLSTDIVSLQSILTDKKTRGIFGEVNLKHILSNVFGEKNDSIYRLQYTLSTGVIADCVVFAPEPLGTIAVVEVRVISVVRIVLRRRPVVVAKSNTNNKQTVNHSSYYPTFDNTKCFGGATTFIILNIFHLISESLLILPLGGYSFFYSI